MNNLAFFDKRFLLQDQWLMFDIDDISVEIETVKQNVSHLYASRVITTWLIACYKVDL